MGGITVPDFLPPPPWEGPPLPEAFLAAFELTPERIALLQEVNNLIRQRTTYGIRQERIVRLPAYLLEWYNSSASWGIASIGAVPATPAAEQVRALYYQRPSTQEAFRQAFQLQQQLTSQDYRKPRPGDILYLDANYVVVYGRRQDLKAIERWFEPLPLYAYSFEAKQRGIYNPLGHLRALFEQWRRGELEEE